MTDQPISQDQLDRYLDGLLSGKELADFEVRLSGDEDAYRQVEIQRQFDAKLRSAFVAPSTTVAQVENSLADVGKISPRRRRHLILMAVSAIAAILAWFFAATTWNGARTVEPFFEQRPLAMIYREAVEQGFRPYYLCEDQERFALTFRKRQNVPLVLAATPDDRRMIGLSYAGGLSRDTTAMLCYVEEQPVVVFVDRKSFDNRPLATRLPDGEQLQVHRSELGDLVLYEVTPFDVPMMSHYLELHGD